MAYVTPEKQREYRQRRTAATATVYPVPDPPVDPAKAIAEWSAGLVIPDGLLAGQRFTIADWQLRFLREALADGVREAGLSVGRKNGKSALVGLLLLAYLVGPLHKPGWRGIVTSVTGELAKELRHQIEAIAETNNLPVEVRRSPTPGEVIAPNRARLSFLAADKSTGHALGADLAVVDELGLIPESKRDLWERNTIIREWARWSGYGNLDNGRA